MADTSKSTTDVQISYVAELVDQFTTSEEERTSELYANVLASVLCALNDKGFTLYHQKCKIANILVASGYLNVKELLSAQLTSDEPLTPNIKLNQEGVLHHFWLCFEMVNFDARTGTNSMVHLDRSGIIYDSPVLFTSPAFGYQPSNDGKFLLNPRCKDGIIRTFKGEHPYLDCLDNRALQVRPCPFSSSIPQVRDTVLQIIFSNAVHHSVIINGLKKAQTLNGKSGTISKTGSKNAVSLAKSGRVCVQMPDNSFKSIKPLNLKLHSKSGSAYLRSTEMEHLSKLLLGQLVQGPGGEVGTICGYDHKKQMFEVEIASEDKRLYIGGDLEPTDAKIENSEPSREKVEKLLKDPNTYSQILEFQALTDSGKTSFSSLMSNDHALNLIRALRKKGFFMLSGEQEDAKWATLEHPKAKKLANFLERQKLGNGMLSAKDQKVLMECEEIYSMATAHGFLRPRVVASHQI